jgi:hypothetical protein
MPPARNRDGARARSRSTVRMVVADCVHRVSRVTLHGVDFVPRDDRERQ